MSPQKDPDKLLEKYHQLLVATTVSLELSMNPQTRSKKQNDFCKMTYEEAIKFLKENGE